MIKNDYIILQTGNEEFFSKSGTIILHIEALMVQW